MMFFLKGLIGASDSVYLQVLNASANPQFKGVCYFGCTKRVSKSVQVRLNGIEAVLLLTLRIPEKQALFKLEAIQAGSERTVV